MSCNAKQHCGSGVWEKEVFLQEVVDQEVGAMVWEKKTERGPQVGLSPPPLTTLPPL